jgi:hypothetical protein
VDGAQISQEPVNMGFGSILGFSQHRYRLTEI